MALLEFTGQDYLPASQVADVSLILPAYNEGTRIEAGKKPGDAFRSALDIYNKFLENEFGQAAELIVVDDGSTDVSDPGSTIRIAREHGAKVLINQDGVNSQRGGALKIGFMQAKGEVRMYTDSDGSYSPATLMDLYSSVSEQGYDIAVAHRSETSNQHSSLVRKYGHSVIHNICELSKFAPTGVKDPQAGAKAFSAEAAKNIWSKVKTNGWAADRESLVIAGELGYSVDQIGAEIEPHDGSTVDIFLDTLRMVRDSMQIGVDRDLGNKRLATKASIFILGKSIHLASKV